MKYIITIISFLIIGFSQAQVSADVFPKYSTDSTGKTTVEMTIQQAQKVDNDYDMLNLLIKQEAGCDKLLGAYKIVVKDQGVVIATQDVKIDELTDLSLTNDSIIDNLRGQINKYIEDQIKSNGLLANQGKEIKALNKEIFKLKVQKIVGFTFVGAFGAVAIGVSAYTIYKSIVK